MRFCPQIDTPAKVRMMLAGNETTQASVPVQLCACASCASVQLCACAAVRLSSCMPVQAVHLYKLYACSALHPSSSAPVQLCARAAVCPCKLCARPAVRLCLLCTCLTVCLCKLYACSAVYLSSCVTQNTHLESLCFLWCSPGPSWHPCFLASCLLCLCQDLAPASLTVYSSFQMRREAFPSPTCQSLSYPTWPFHPLLFPISHDPGLLITALASEPVSRNIVTHLDG